MSEKNVCRDILRLSPQAQKACRLFLSECERQGLNVLITETYRSQERQDYLYAQGRTRPGNKVTWTKNSRHTSGRAWDICKNVKGEEYSDAEFFKKCGSIAKNLGIIWGGEWKTPDTPHFEINKDWKEEINMEELNNLKAENEYLKKSLDALADRVTKLENPMIYNYVDENMPVWARETIKKLSDKNLLLGDENSELGLNDDMLRILSILDRAGAFEN